MIVNGATSKFALSLVKQLGLPLENLKGFDLHCYADDLVTVTCTYFKPEEDKEVEKKFNLVFEEETEAKSVFVCQNKRWGRKICFQHDQNK